ncbi:MAG: PHP domain-containing protein [Clostridia bacterium]|nr:PHP domain-containing protein [Clostridia bacterium]
MRIAYDFHIHTALSPCGDGDMTPNNIVNMATLKGLDVIAITDHNTCGNAEACMKCAEGGELLVLPGMEVETAEECHIVCLFPNLKSAREMEEKVRDALPKIRNRTDIFGEQVYLDENDEIIGYEENMLVTATSLSVDKVSSLARSFGGVAIPAHIDKSSYSVISNLGIIDDAWGFTTVEIKDLSKEKSLQENNGTDRFRVIHSSDAHYLWDISEREYFLDVESLTPEAIINTLLR